MEILVIGNKNNLNECRQKFGDQHVYRFTRSHSAAEELLNSETITFDFKIGGDPDGIGLYKNFDGVVFLDVSKRSLDKLINTIETNATFFGFCGMPIFLDREVLEISLHQKIDLEQLEDVCRNLNTKFAVVTDQVGLITPRVICMIINEAFFSIQEDIASRGDINLAMKLGTNYPFGPFEWCAKIGAKNVYELLAAVYESTKEERYKVCELLKEEAEASY